MQYFLRVLAATLLVFVTFAATLHNSSHTLNANSHEQESSSCDLCLLAQQRVLDAPQITLQPVTLILTSVVGVPAYEAPSLKLLSAFNVSARAPPRLVAL